MAGSNSSVHGENNVEGDVPVTLAVLDAKIREVLNAEMDTRFASLERLLGERLPTAGNGAQHQPCPAASLVADNGRNPDNDGRYGGRE